MQHLAASIGWRCSTSVLLQALSAGLDAAALAAAALLKPMYVTAATAPSSSTPPVMPTARPTFSPTLLLLLSLLREPEPPTGPAAASELLPGCVASALLGLVVGLVVAWLSSASAARCDSLGCPPVEVPGPSPGAAVLSPPVGPPSDVGCWEGLSWLGAGDSSSGEGAGPPELCGTAGGLYPVAPGEGDASAR